MNVESLDIESHRQVSSTVVSPFPIFYDSEVTCGFGRGSSDLGIPTANISVGKLDSLDPGVYFGWCRLTSGKNQKERIIERPNGSKVSFNNGLSLTDSDLKVLPMVMSIGWNPFYENKQKAAEVHIMHKFHHDFYGAALKVVILGYMRPELNYTTKEALIKDINMDIESANIALDSVPYSLFQTTLNDKPAARLE